MIAQEVVRLSSIADRVSAANRHEGGGPAGDAARLRAVNVPAPAGVAAVETLRAMLAIEVEAEGHSAVHPNGGMGGMGGASYRESGLTLSNCVQGGRVAILGPPPTFRAGVAIPSGRLSRGGLRVESNARLQGQPTGIRRF